MKKDLLSIDDLDLAALDHYLGLAGQIAGMADSDKAQLLAGQLLAVLFYEPSTRTRLSFEAAMGKLGGAVTGFSETAGTSVSKGESFLDTVRTIEQYADALVIRHPREGAARLAAENCGKPVINAGDGANQHPSQTLLDLFTIQSFFGRLKDLKIALVGDLKYSRTVHSLLHALRRYPGNRFTLVSPEALRLRDEFKMVRPGESCSFVETTDLQATIASCDLLYVTRIQRERFGDLLEYERVKNAYVLDATMLKDAPEHLRIMHPLPRVNEIARDVDRTPHAGYFEQVRNGLFMRQAILLDLLGVTL